MESIVNKVVVSGLGYIGLPTASILANRGISVVGVDVSKDVVETINKGNIHIVEPDLDVLVRSAVHSGNLKASPKPEPADAFIIAVPTPFVESTEQKKLDFSYVESATKAICPYLENENLIVLESTSEVGTTERIHNIILKERPDLKQVYVAHCPERVLPGHILKELVENDRIVGGIDQQSSKLAREMYSIFCQGEILETDCRTAELVKLAENTFRDINIAYANELSLICDELEIDVWEMIKLANRHPRVNILNPGPGVGGHCIAVDPWFIVSSAPETTKLIKTAREVNDKKPQWVVDQIQRKSKEIENPVIGCLGITFKADVDDLRESPSMNIVEQLIDLDLGEILVCDPYVTTQSPSIPLTSLDNVIDRSDILVLLVDHTYFKSIQYEKIATKILIDTRGIWNKH